ncbi:ribonuclease HII [Candidatus Woesearchaeota archaeon]|nr:ribonuclease HII [Candidatus Woesearchaeota archaeon]
MAWICGVEEAGRGPVLGPMTMACCWVEEKDSALLREIGAKDSKLLTPQQREETLERLKELKKKKKVGFELIILSPKEIDSSVEGENDNLNLLELRTSITLINKALKKKKITKALIDCPTKNTEKYAADIKALLDKDIEVIAEHKADVTYPVVSAASIIAKVNRDKEIEKLQKNIKQPIGSGYPADPSTQQFLRENYKEKKYKDIFRKSWATYKNVVEAGKQRSLFHFETESEQEKKKEAEHAEEIKKFAALEQHGYEFVPPKTQYEILRMTGPGATVIKYTTGKLLIQGSKIAKAATEDLFKRHKLV